MIKYCECNCGQIVKNNRRCIDGHRNKILIRDWTKEELKLFIKDIFKIKKLTRGDFWYNYNFYGLPSMNVINKLFINLNNLAIECDIEFAKRDRAEYLKNNPDVQQKILKNNKIFYKISWNERYGKEKSLKLKNKLSNSCIGRKAHNKGKTNIELYGIEKAQQLTDSNKLQATKYSNEFLKEKILEVFKENNYHLTKKQLCKLLEYKYNINSETIRYRYKLFSNIEKLYNIKFDRPKYRSKNFFNCRKGSFEDEILNYYEKENNIKLDRDGIIFINEKKYFLPDGIDYNNKIIIEIDETYHNRNIIKKYDIERDKQILQVLPEFKIVRLIEKDLLNIMKKSQHL